MVVNSHKLKNARFERIYSDVDYSCDGHQKQLIIITECNSYDIKIYSLVI